MHSLLEHVNTQSNPHNGQKNQGHDNLRTVVEEVEENGFDVIQAFNSLQRSLMCQLGMSIGYVRLLVGSTSYLVRMPLFICRKN